jgi:hypothetical protein
LQWRGSPHGCWIAGRIPCRELSRVVDGFLAHQGNMGVTGLVAIGLFMAAWPLGVGAWTLLRPPSAGLRKMEGAGLGVLAAGCICAASVLPFIIRPGFTVFRPSTKARVEIVSPHSGETVPAGSVHLVVRVVGGKVVPFTSKHLVPNEGHLHVWLDRRLVSMLAGTTTIIPVSAGTHTLQVEFVAIDHGPFSPRVRESVTFGVRPP